MEKISLQCKNLCLLPVLLKVTNHQAQQQAVLCSRIARKGSGMMDRVRVRRSKLQLTLEQLTPRRYEAEGVILHTQLLFLIPPPSQLTIEHLRRKYLIAEIERSNAKKLYYNRAVRFMAFMTESVRNFAGANGFKLPGSCGESTSQAHEHSYSMGLNEEEDEDTETHDN